MREVFESLREKWQRILTGGRDLDVKEVRTAAHIAEIASTAESYWRTMGNGREREYLWADLAGTNSSLSVTVAYIRIKEMALAYVLEGSNLKNNFKLRNDIIGALDWMYENRFNEGIQQYSNWWHWQIGAPLALNDSVILLYDVLRKDQIQNYMRAIDHFTPTPLTSNLTGANRIWICLVIAIRSVILCDRNRLADARDEISPVFPNVKKGDGFYEDGSFIQHGHFAYTGSYGRSMLLDISKLLYLLNGTEWEVTDALKENVYHWIFEGFEPVMYKGSLMDMIRGREISRHYSQEHESGHHVIESVMRLAQIAPKESAIRMQRMAKHWIQADTCLHISKHEIVPYGMATSLEKITLSNELFRANEIEPRTGYKKFKKFSSMDRAVFHRDHFAFGISMFSNRIASYESINGENLKGWYTAYGMTYLYNDDLGQFSDGFWPTVNPYRLPGTTVTTTPKANSFGCHRRSSKSFVGGVELLETYGAVGMELEDYKEHPEEESLTVKKSWFLFETEIVSLGSNVHTARPDSVETIVENRKLNEKGDNVLIVNGVVKPKYSGWAEELVDTNWIFLAANTVEGNIGYYFPGTPTLKALRETRSGTWRDIGDGEGNYTSGTEEMTRNYLSIWFDHGISPTQRKYSYVLLPGLTVDQLKEYARDPQIVILEQSSEAHAVYHKKLNMYSVLFWNDGPKMVGPITSHQQAAVMIKISNGEIDLALSDPTQNQGKISIAIEWSVKEVISSDPNLTVNKLAPNVEITADVRESMGRTLHIKLKI